MWTRNSQPTASFSPGCTVRTNLLRPSIRGRYSIHSRYSTKSRTTAPHPAASGPSQQLTPQPEEVCFVEIPHLAEHSPLHQRRPIEQHAKYLGVTLSSDGSTHTQRQHHQTCQSTKAFPCAPPILEKHRLHTEVEASHIQCGRHSTRHIWAGDGWGVQLSQWEITTDWRPSIPKACGRTLHLKRTYYTQVLEPTGRTCTNQEVRALTSQPPLAHHKAQLKLFGHILLRSHPHSIKRNCCFTKFFQYRGGAVGAGLRPGRRRVRLTEQSIKLLWHWL